MCGERVLPGRAPTSRSTRATRSDPSSPGPNGCVLFEMMMGDPRSFPADQEAYQKFLADQGVVPLPNPPIDMPDSTSPDTRN